MNDEVTNPVQAAPSVFRRFLPLMIFAALVVLFAIGLTLNPRLVPSPYIDKPAPEFRLPLLLAEGEMTENDLRCGVTLLNVWASWCYACRQEHAAITWLAENGFRVMGFNYKDKPQDAKAWLQQYGNPYLRIASDIDGSAGIDWGVYGAPETFVIDEAGIVRDKRVGPVDRTYIEETLLPLAQEIRQTSTCEG